METGEIAARDKARVSALVLTLLVGLTDGVSGSVTTQMLAIDAIKSLLDGTLVRPTAER